VSGRKLRVEQALRDTLAEMIPREVKDPRVKAAGLVSITRVECNVDMSVANVYVSIYGTDAVADKAVAGLQAAAGFLRGPAGRALNMRHPPELRFQRDVTPEVSLKLAEIIRDDEQRARAVGRVPGQAPDPPPTAPANGHLDPDESGEGVTRDFGQADEEPTADLHPTGLASPDDSATPAPLIPEDDP
jgi:ribosome-binding factor A